MNGVLLMHECQCGHMHAHIQICSYVHMYNLHVYAWINDLIYQ